MSFKYIFVWNNKAHDFFDDIPSEDSSPMYIGNVYPCDNPDVKTGWIFDPATNTFSPPVKTDQEIITELTNVVQIYLDKKAREKNYDSILSACSYANSTNPKFKDEALAYITFRDNAWTTCYQILADVQSGTREIPTSVELLAELPALVLP